MGRKDFHLVDIIYDTEGLIYQTATKMHKIERKTKVIVTAKLIIILPPLAGGSLEGGGNSPSPRPSPIKGEEFIRNYTEDYIQPRMSKEVKEWQ